MNFDYPATMRFRCIKCGICCGDTEEKTRHVLLLETEVEQIAKATSRSASEFAVKIDDRTPYRYEMKKSETGKCVFLKNNCCGIYSLRPLICRFYPFELKSSSNGKYRFLFTEECHGINKGRMLGEGYFRKMFRLACAKHKQASDSDRETDSVRCN